MKEYKEYGCNDDEDAAARKSSFIRAIKLLRDKKVLDKIIACVEPDEKIYLSYSSLWFRLRSIRFYLESDKKIPIPNMDLIYKIGDILGNDEIISTESLKYFSPRDSDQERPVSLSDYESIIKLLNTRFFRFFNSPLENFFKALPKKASERKWASENVATPSYPFMQRIIKTYPSLPPTKKEEFIAQLSKRGS